MNIPLVNIGDDFPTRTWESIVVFIDLYCKSANDLLDVML